MNMRAFITLADAFKRYDPFQCRWPYYRTMALNVFADLRNVQVTP
jgi:hypothetical protein